jgi:hypothetical protein
MSFLAPLWLAALVPWAAVSLWLIRGSGNSQAVPFLRLWTAQPTASPRNAHTLRRPPAWLLCMVTAMGLAVLAAAQPVWRVHPPVTAAAERVDPLSIVLASARATPTAQVMVRLRNDSSAASGVLRLNSAGQDIQAPITLPPHGQQRDYFLNPAPPLGDLVRVEASAADTSAADRRPAVITLARPVGWPCLMSAAESPPPAPMQRMMQVYGSRRPPADRSVAALISTAAIPPTATGLQIVPPTAPLGSNPTLAALLTVSPHPVAANVLHWPGPAAATAGPPPGMTAIVTRGPTVLLAASQIGGSRQLWANLELQSWDQTPDFVVFCTNAFDWLGIAAEDRSGLYIPQTSVAGAWKNPGTFAVASVVDRISPPAARSLQAWFSLAAAGVAMGAAALWPENRLQK